MRLAVIGLSHQELSLDQRGLFSFTDTKILEFSALLMTYQVEQIVILSTCNRSEVYVAYDEDIDFLPHVYQEYFQQKNVPYYFKKEDEAIEHLLKVTCGLKSMLLREDQILGQVKKALEFSMNMQLGGKEIYFIFQEAIRFAKEIKSKYKQPSLSLTHLSIQHLKERMELKNKNILICGAGEISRSFVPYLYDDNHLTFANRTHLHLSDLIEEYPQIDIVPFQDRKKDLKDYDVLISATSGPHIIFPSECLQNTHLIAIDLAIPRDIEKTEGIEVIDLEGLNQEIQLNNEKRNQDEQVILNELDHTVKTISIQLGSFKNDYMIQSLQQKSLSIADSTYELLRHKLSLNTKDEYILQKTLRAAFLQIMKEPIHCIKNGQINDVQIIQELFNIEEGIE